VLKKAGRPLSSIESFVKEFVPSEHDLAKSTENLSIDPTATATTGSPDEVPTVSIHALDVLAEINAQKNPQLAKQCLKELAEKYDTMRRGYWEFRMEKVGREVNVQS